MTEPTTEELFETLRRWAKEADGACFSEGIGPKEEFSLVDGLLSQVEARLTAYRAVVDAAREHHAIHLADDTDETVLTLSAALAALPKEEPEPPSLDRQEVGN